MILNALGAAAFLTASAPVFGNVIGTYQLNGDGTATYSYVVDNSGGSFDIAAWSLEFGFATPDWNQLDGFSGGDVTVPNAHWFADAGSPVTGLSAQDFIALSPAGDVSLGKTLDGISFTSAFLPGTISYYEFSAAGNSLTGTTIGPVATVPEQGSSIAALALAAIAVFGAGTRASGDRNRQLATR